MVKEALESLVNTSWYAREVISAVRGRNDVTSMDCCRDDVLNQINL